MIKFNLKFHNEKEFVLMNSSDLVEIYNCINDEENFIVEYESEGVTKAELIIGANIKPKVENNDIKLKSEE